MRILGHGIDLYELARVEKHLRGERSDWLEGVFSEEELKHADAPRATSSTTGAGTRRKRR